MDSTLGQNIRKIREIKDLSQSFVADKLKVSQSYYSEIENGKVIINSEKLEEIAKILEVTPEFIEKFNSQFIFNSCTQSGQFNNSSLQHNDNNIELYKEIIENLKSNIESLNRIIASKEILIEELKKGRK